jgi:hypothetical protein
MGAVHYDANPGKMRGDFSGPAKDFNRMFGREGWAVLGNVT